MYGKKGILPPVLIPPKEKKEEEKQKQEAKLVFIQLSLYNPLNIYNYSLSHYLFNSQYNLHTLFTLLGGVQNKVKYARHCEVHKVKTTIPQINVSPNDILAAILKIELN